MGVKLARRPSLGAVVLLAILVAILVSGGDDGGGESEPGAPSGERPAAQTTAPVVEVVEVVDGDTIEVEIGGEVEDVRYIGIDTPESVTPGQPVECFGVDASRENRRLVGGETVRLVFDAERRDRYGRLLAYVYLGERLVNAELIRGGFATTLTIAPNDSLAPRLRRLEQEAGNAGRGLWGSC